MTGPGRGLRRPGWAVLGVGALGVATLFATVGDGVDVPGAAGLRRLLVDHAHTAVWALLAAAFGTAAVRDGWTRTANGLALAAGAA